MHYCFFVLDLMEIFIFKQLFFLFCSAYIFLLILKWTLYIFGVGN